MKKFGSLLVVAAVALALLPAGLAQAKSPQLKVTTFHTPGTEFAYPYLEAWEGPVSGDIDGWIEWWIDVESWTAWDEILAEEPLPNASHYTVIARIYEYEDGPLLLETLEHGTTTLANTTWRANGVVTKASQEFASWIGRNVHESGEFTMGPMGPVEGTSDFRIN